MCDHVFAHELRASFLCVCVAYFLFVVVAAAATATATPPQSLLSVCVFTELCQIKTTQTKSCIIDSNRFDNEIRSA